MSFDLTNKNIKDTFQNLLQKTGSEGHLYDLVGNQIDNLTIGGTLTAHSYITSQSVVNTSSGSTAFGNSSDDSHTFQGSITASGNISSSGTITATKYDAPQNLEGAGGYKFGGRDDTGMFENAFNIGIVSPENVQINIDSNNNDTSPPSQFAIVHHNEVVDGSPTNTLFQVFEDGRTHFTTGSVTGSTINHSSGDFFTKGNITASGNISSSGTSHIFGGTIETNTINASIIGASSTNATFRGNNINIIVDSGGDILFKENLTEVMRYDGGLDAFGIGTSTPSSKLTVAGDISSSGNVFIEPSNKIYLSSPNTNDSIIQTGAGSNSPGLNIQSRQEPITFYQGLATNTQLFITASGGDGFVGIGTQTPVNQLQVNGNISASGFISTKSHITASGNISSSFTSTGSFGRIECTTISASSGQFDGASIFLGNESFTKSNIETLKLGRSLKNIRIGRSKPDIDGDDGNFDGNISASGDILNTQIVQMTNSSSIVNTFNTGSFRSSKYLLQVTSASNYQVSELLVLHHNTTASNTEYAQLNSGVNLVDFSTKVVNSFVELIASSSFISCSVKFERTIIPT